MGLGLSAQSNVQVVLGKEDQPLWLPVNPKLACYELVLTLVWDKYDVRRPAFHLEEIMLDGTSSVSYVIRSCN